MSEIEIGPFDPTSMAPDATILIVGKRHTGKTVLTRDLMWHLREKIDLCVGMNPTEMANHNLEHFIPKSFIYHEYSDEKVEHILDWQRRAVANNKARRVAFIMDDCMSEQTPGPGGKGKKRVMQSNAINKIFKLGRHLKILFVNCMQYIKDAPPDIRGNVDLLFAFATTSNAEREKLWKEYFAMFSNFRDFCRVFDECTKEYECIVLDTRKAARNPLGAISFYKATLRPDPFRVGRGVYWKMSQHYYEDTADYSMDPARVLGVAARTLAPDLIDPDDEYRPPADDKGIRVIRKLHQ